MESGRISSASLTASSHSGPDSFPANARLHFKQGAWSPRIADHNQWLQVDFGINTQVIGISTQGHIPSYVKSYSLNYSNDGLFFAVYEPVQGNKVKLFQIIT